MQHRLIPITKPAIASTDDAVRHTVEELTNLRLRSVSLAVHPPGGFCSSTGELVCDTLPYLYKIQERAYNKNVAQWLPIARQTAKFDLRYVGTSVPSTSAVQENEATPAEELDAMLAMPMFSVRPEEAAADAKDRERAAVQAEVLEFDDIED